MKRLIDGLKDFRACEKFWRPRKLCGSATKCSGMCAKFNSAYETWILEIPGLEVSKFLADLEI
jgi:hypothetical protein